MSGPRGERRLRYQDEPLAASSACSGGYSVVVSVAAAHGMGGDAGLIRAIAEGLVASLLPIITDEGSATMASRGWRFGSGINQFAEEATRSLAGAAEIVLANCVSEALADEICADAIGAGHGTAKVQVTAKRWLLGHSGEFRGAKRGHRNCCKLSSADDGVHLCTHGATAWSAADAGDSGVTRRDHWSCCGVPREEARCLCGVIGAELAVAVAAESALLPAVAVAPPPVRRQLSLGALDNSLRAVLPSLATFLTPVANATPTDPDAVAHLPQRLCRSDSSGAKEDRCSICLETYTKDDVVVSLECGHSFDKGCLLPWLKEHNNCPVCRAPLPLDPTSAAGVAKSAAECAMWICAGCAAPNPRGADAREDGTTLCTQCGASYQVSCLLPALERHLVRPTAVVAAATHALARLLAAAEDDAAVVLAAAPTSIGAAPGPGPAPGPAPAPRPSRWSHFEALCRALRHNTAAEEACASDGSDGGGASPSALADVAACAELVAAFDLNQDVLVQRLARDGFDLRPGVDAVAPRCTAALDGAGDAVAGGGKGGDAGGNAAAEAAAARAGVAAVRLRPRGARSVLDIDDPFLVTGREPQRTDVRVVYAHLCRTVLGLVADLDARAATVAQPLIDAIAQAGVAGGNVAQAMAPLQLAFAVITNVLEDPGSERKRKVKIASLAAKSGDNVDVVPLLRAAGFRVVKRGAKGLYLVMTSEQLDGAMPILTACVEALKVAVGEVGDALAAP